MFNIAVYYNNFNLASLPGVKIVNYNVTDLPNRALNNAKLARSNKSILTSAEYSDKTVTITGFIGGDDWIQQQDNFDGLKARVQDVEGIVRVQQGSKSVEYTGTLNAITKEWGGPSLGFTLQFVCSDPIGKDFTTVPLFSPLTITTATLLQSIVVEGTFIAEPRYTITVNAVTGGTNKTITLLNSGTGKGIKITRNWVPGDVVSVASDTLEVLSNSQLSDFSGQFPTFLPGARALQYIDDFSTRNITLTATYNRKYS